MSPVYLEDKAGLFRIDHLSAVLPAQIRGDKRDQSVITAVHAVLFTVGGSQHSTELPYKETLETVKQVWSGSSDSQPQTPAPQGQ